MRARTLMSVMLMSSLAIAAGGCYEDAGGTPPPAPQQAAGTKEGPLTEMSRGGGTGAQPALGKAKKTATNIVDQAEQKSREVADQADDPLADKPKREPAPADDPG